MSDEEDFYDNPLHRIGYGRGDDEYPTAPQDTDSVPKHSPHKTQTYSFVNSDRAISPDKIVNVGEKKLEPTQPMKATETLTVKDIIHQLVERNLQAWKALPEKVRDKMLERPGEFQLLLGANPVNSNEDCIVHNGIVLRYSPTAVAWVLYDLR